ncbi:tyrosine-type recombinase/integrase [Nonomuraea aurantiaca]|uniref:tyrosine-type recombinase/integrase n=1 Tax=Nonomuraea aurantiaca TaxID=2878562 RepID=UPI001CD9594B|nr:site-specific integrase [Nonomuraea aurantiaca]MCA2226332.1 site-specific integrase [Nonomuraea aurantiaca]
MAYAGSDEAIPVTIRDRAAFTRWCAKEPALLCNGQINLLGLQPLVAAELRWGLFTHAQQIRRAYWPVLRLQHVATACRGLAALQDFDHAGAAYGHSAIISEIQRELRIIYYTPEDTKQAGYIEFRHFGKAFPKVRTEHDLTAISQRWLRDLVWDFFADLLIRANGPRSDNIFTAVRGACKELSAFLEAHGDDGGHTPALLTSDLIRRFVADQRHRAAHQMRSLARTRKGKPSLVTQSSCKILLDRLHTLTRWALDTERDGQIGVDRAVLRAFPGGGKLPNRPRNPFTDEVAQALADEGNLRRLADKDTTDRGFRDIWETLVVTGRRAGEIIKLRVDCIGRYNGVPMLWHDQTKVGNFDQAIRIPERTYQRLDQRRQLTLTRYAERFGHSPTPQERVTLALFPTNNRNPDGRQAIAYSTFRNNFAEWIAELDLGALVAHQARHTLATKLLANGAALPHIKRYLGQVSERMAEHYAHVALSEIDDVLQRVWVTGPGSAEPGRLLSTDLTPMTREQAQALALDLNRRSTPTEGGLCTFQPVVDGGACPWNLAPLTDLTPIFQQFMAAFRLPAITCPRDRIERGTGTRSGAARGVEGGSARDHGRCP